MTSIKNNIKLILVLVSSILVCFLIFKYSIVDIKKIVNLKEEFHYNSISMSAIIGGFLFTGISILISAIQNERIKRLWDNNYLNNLYNSAFVGMISNIATIICAFIIICVPLNEKLTEIAIKIEISTLIIGLVFFIWSIKHLMFIISRMKTTKGDNQII